MNSWLHNTAYVTVLWIDVKIVHSMYIRIQLLKQSAYEILAVKQIVINRVLNDIYSKKCWIAQYIFFFLYFSSYSFLTFANNSLSVLRKF